jgi:hypothetical protein
VTVPVDGTTVWDFTHGIIIAGDGYAYVPYTYGEWPVPYDLQVNHLRLLRVSSSGAHDDSQVFECGHGL